MDINKLQERIRTVKKNIEDCQMYLGTCSPGNEDFSRCYSSELNWKKELDKLEQELNNEIDCIFSK